MTDSQTDLISLATRNEEQIARLTDRIFAATQPGVVFGQPVTQGSYTVIPCSEVTAGGGFGLGLGFGQQRGPEKASPPPEGEATSPRPEAGGGGGGMGGGGGSVGRPVAVIVIGPDGVRVRPIVDATKIALAGVAAWGALLAAGWRMRRATK